MENTLTHLLLIRKTQELVHALESLLCEVHFIAPVMANEALY